MADLGGGTGLLSEHILFWQPRVRLTFVEPSRDMAVHARRRLKDRYVHFIENTFQQACPLPDAPYKALVSVRSFYAMETERNRYPALFRLLAEQLEPGGRLFLMDLKNRFQDEENEPFWAELRTRLVSRKCTEREFDRMRETIQWAREEFNRGVDAGHYHLFAQEELDEMAFDAAFVLETGKKGDGMHRLIYRKKN